MVICFSDNTQYFPVLGVNIISIIGCFAVIITFLTLRDSQTYSLRLVFYIAITDFIKSISFCIPCHMLENNILINFSAFLARASAVITCLWAVAISNALYQIVINNVEKFEKFHKRWIIILIILIALNIGLMFINVYTSVDTLCTFNLTPLGNYLRIGTIYAPEWLFLIYSILAYYKVQKKIRNLTLTETKAHSIKRLFVFSIATFITYLPMSIIRIVEMFYNDCIINEAYLFAFCIYSLAGLLNALAYFWAFNLHMIWKKKTIIVSIPLRASEVSSINLLYHSLAK
ncbi:hypothetical protein SteCoe_17908 [Stentor coeruleus]|uniref:G-protein coupled receptors family 1 profile domain-containing protein n=1 Tax=Stentor coeruleus TaxID=5963 RepID=A0A1R2BXS4_9CILI|nr:hypothetical protein SteCoe_17908 [Stentor coeruleus]